MFLDAQNTHALLAIAGCRTQGSENCRSQVQVFWVAALNHWTAKEMVGLEKTGESSKDY